MAPIYQDPSIMVAHQDPSIAFARPDPVPLGGMRRNDVPGIHWFGPGGSGIGYPGYPDPRFHPLGPGFPIHGLPPGSGIGGIPRPGYHPALARAAASRAAQRALFLRRRLY